MRTCPPEQRLPALVYGLAAGVALFCSGAAVATAGEFGRLLQEKGGMALSDDDPAVLELIVELTPQPDIHMPDPDLTGAARQAVLERRAAQLSEAKAALLDGLAHLRVERVRDYAQLPMMVLRLGREDGLRGLLRSPRVAAVYRDGRLRTSLAQSLVQVRQPEAAGLGALGGGTVAVLDTGVDYTLPAFGSCTAPGVPASSCRVVAAEDVAPGDGALDDDGHGTHTAAVALAVAPGAGIAALDVFDGSSARFSDVLGGIDWAIANQVTYGITALNLSLGDGCRYQAPCTTIRGPSLLGGIPCQRAAANPFVTPVDAARAAGIVVAASAGNEGYADGIAAPACTPGALSVGAVYDADVGRVDYSACSDATTAPDQVTCFSNSADFLSLLAPGALITALTESQPGGVTYAGTSEAAPHVAGAAAVLAALYPGESVAQLEARLLDGVPVTDPRNGVTRPRLDLLDALGAPNDAFAAALPLPPAGAVVFVDATDASAEPGEPSHAGVPASASVWWTYTAEEEVVVTLDTTGSSFDTVLAVYAGGAVATLTPIAANDDSGDGSSSRLSFRAAAGASYRIAVDTAGAPPGVAVLGVQVAPAPPPARDEEIPFLPPAALAALAAALAAGGAWRMRGRVR